MKKTSLLVLGLLLLIMSACNKMDQKTPKPTPGNNGDRDEIVEDNGVGEVKKELQDRIKIVEEENLPPVTREWFQQFGNHQGAYIYEEPSATYIRINAGEKPTGGYRIRVEDYIEDDSPRIITVDIIEPKDKDIVTEAITYPFTILKIHSDMVAEYEVKTADGKSFNSEERIVLAKFELPEKNEEVGNPVEIKGEIAAFEGSFSVRILDNKGDILHEEHLQADAGGPYWGKFHEKITYPATEAKGGRIELGEYSAKDGVYIMREFLPIKFKSNAD